ncbi:MAG: hypothetical protein F6K28_49200 [Microcoleus sp. SIO2G3]|nr:hypothetical protein [Microcoleus sp. SIO2G3]
MLLSFYHQSVVDCENEIKNRIANLAAEHPTYGYRCITAMLHPLRASGQQKASVVADARVEVGG